MNTETLFILVGGGMIWGYLLSKLTFDKNDIKKWWYPFRNIDYYVCYILENGRVTKTNVIKADKSKYKVGTKEYFLFNKEKEGEEAKETPYIVIDKHKTVFHNSNNLNALSFAENPIEPLSNDPEVYATLLRNKEIRDTLAPDLDQFRALKTFIAMMIIAAFGAFAGLMYFLTM